jgi:para-nitrobenzyl esterase
MPKSREVVVDTSAGRLAGHVFDDGFAFKGIPYGEPPEGELRFRPAVLRSPWSGVRKATALGPVCVQTNEDYPAWRDATPASEDCLVANVWTPTIESAANLPVMVWIHGGAYSSGSAGLAMYDGGRLSKAENVVVVSINHRLNIFGYLYLGGISSAYADSANLGLQDIVLALQWVQGNISRFGGNPANVTLFGESGGGGKIAALMAMPTARGLFSRVIIQSGWLLNTLSPDQATQRAELVRRTLGIGARHIDRLRFLPAAMLNEAGGQLLAQSGYGMFFPVADGKVIPANPWASRADYPAATVPMLVGTTADEGAYFIPEAMHREPITSDNKLRRAIVKLTSPLHLTQGEAQQLLQRYRESHSQEVSRGRCLMDILTDILFVGNAVHQAERHSLRSHVFMYRFDWTYPCWGGRYSPHAAEIPFVFGTLDYEKPAFGNDDSPHKRAAADPLGERFTLARHIQKSWAAFARSGDPSHAEMPRWERYSSKSRSTMILDRRCRVERDVHESARLLAKELMLPRRSLRAVSAARAMRVRAEH